MQKTVCVLIAVLAFPGAAIAAAGSNPPVRAWMALPFLALLFAIAIVPFISRSWWSRHYPKVSLGLGFTVLSCYSFVADFHRILDTMAEYFSFIVLIGSLFVAAGGILIHTERRATPLLNTAFLAAGALVSNFLGTTGASMLLIRPFIRINRVRFSGFHLAFFIFIVSNIGGGLTPIGDPPLLLGYLAGVPFHWTILNLCPVWLVALCLLLAVFFTLDSIAYRRWAGHQGRPPAPGSIHLHGRRNFVFLLIILAAVFTRTPAREIIMLAAAAAAYRFAHRDALRANEFTFEPIREVAFIFAGIFATMMPALDWLNVNASKLGLRAPGEFFWASGLLSAVLDNAPAYLNFLSAALGIHGLTLANPADVGVLSAQHGSLLAAISAGSVFFGAATYIGNGPNFMVKSIAEHLGIQCPSFFVYIARYSLPVLAPVLAVVWLLFFR